LEAKMHRQKWEYMPFRMPVLHDDRFDASLQQLNKLGQEGWEVVIGMEDLGYLLLKRPA
jgi:hypothetical protein